MINYLLLLTSLLLPNVFVPTEGQMIYKHYNEFMNFTHTYNKTYDGTAEFWYRYNIFSNNLDKIYNHNSNYDIGTSTYRLGINSFTDLTPKEFREQYLSSLLKHKPKPSYFTYPYKMSHLKILWVVKRSWRGKSAQCFLFLFTL